jgi:hypothetical protein
MPVDEAVLPRGVNGNVKRDRSTTVLVAVTGLLLLAILMTPVVATLTGARDGFMVNGDEAVAALLPVHFARGGPDLVFPGNAYQGVLEVPAYAALWWIAGPYEIPMRLLHQVIWLAALGVWTWLALDVVGRSIGASTRARWWGALGVVGLLGLTSVAGWPTWFRIYPGYQLGALLSGLGVLVAVRSQRWWHWGAAGALAGLAVYAQPMHLAGAVAVLVAAVVAVASPVSLWRRLAAVAVGGLLGVSPLLAWNIRNSFGTLDSSSQPVQHPDWTYVDRLVNTVRVTGRVLWGDASSPLNSWAAVVRVVVVVALVFLMAVGAVALVRAGRRAWPLLAVVSVCLLGLPVLSALSLDVDYRYAVGWWPALVVLVAAGTVTVAETTPAPARRWVLGGLAVVIVLHGLVVVDGAVPLVRERAAYTSAEASTRDLASDLERCGVDAVAGDYWTVYPAVWGSDGGLRGKAFFGPDRLSTFDPTSWSGVRRLAVVPPPSVKESLDAANLVALRTGRGEEGWVSTTHPGTGSRVLLEKTGMPLPRGCLGENGLVPS